jgi:hypothetical protein
VSVDPGMLQTISCFSSRGSSKNRPSFQVYCKETVPQDEYFMRAL